MKLGSLEELISYLCWLVSYNTGRLITTSKVQDRNNWALEHYFLFICSSLWKKMPYYEKKTAKLKVKHPKPFWKSIFNPWNIWRVSPSVTCSTGPISIKHGLWTANWGLRTADCGLRAADCELRTADCGLRTADCRLPTADRVLLPKGESFLEHTARRAPTRRASFPPRAGGYCSLESWSLWNQGIDWPEVKAEDSAPLDRFFIFLMRCKHAMECSKYLTKLEQPDTIQKLIMNLPLNSRWVGHIIVW